MLSLKKAASAVASGLISACFLVGCAEAVAVNTDELMRDIDVQPTQIAAYEEYSREEITNYLTVAESHLNDDGEINHDDPEVIAAACSAGAKLFAYACYNERMLDQYVFFADQEGSTDISAGSAKAAKQEYYLRVNESEKTCGYRYHYTIKKVNDISGTISMFKSAFESARTRITDKTDLLYRLEGKNIRTGAKNDTLGVDMLECDWETGSDWGESEVRMVKRGFIAPSDIEADIIAAAKRGEVKGEDTLTIRANINILADDIVKHAIIIRTEDEEKGEPDGYLIVLQVDTEVANNDEASLLMLRQANGSNDCEWVNEVETGDDGKEEVASGLCIAFRIWENGLFRSYTVSEKWKGKISGFSGTADSMTQYFYSYSDRDCDMTKYLQMLEEAKASKGE